MKRRFQQTKTWWGWALLLTLLSLGCGNLLGVARSVQEAKSTVEAAVTAAPTLIQEWATALPTVAAETEDESPTSESEAKVNFAPPDTVDTIRSYRMHWEVSFIVEDKDERYPIIEIDYAVNKDQNAEHVIFYSEKQEGEAMEWVHIDDRVWMHSSDGEWLIVDAGSQNMLWAPLEGWMQPLEAASQWQRVGEETVNGIPTIHYHFTSYPKLYLSQIDELLLGTDLSTLYEVQAAGDGEGDVWLTPDNIAIKYQITFPLVAIDNEGTKHPARWIWRYEITDLNAAIDIQPPTPAEYEVQVPVPENATLSMAQPGSGMWLYSLQDMDLATLIAFYQEQAEKGALSLQNVVGSADEGFWQATVVLPNGEQYSLSAGPQGDALMLVIQR